MCLALSLVLRARLGIQHSSVICVFSYLCVQHPDITCKGIIQVFKLGCHIYSIELNNRNTGRLGTVNTTTFIHNKCISNALHPADHKLILHRERNETLSLATDHWFL